MTPDTENADAEPPEKAVMHIKPDGTRETFEPEWAAAVMGDHEFEGDSEMSDNNLVVTVTGTDKLDRPIELEYSLSQIMIEVAEYDDPDNATFTTAPADTERVEVYGRDTYNPDAIAFSDGDFNLLGGVKELNDRCEYTEFTEDFMLVHGYDDADPVPNDYDMYYILTRASVDGREFFRHENATQKAMLERLAELEETVHSLS